MNTSKKTVPKVLRLLAKEAKTFSERAWGKSTGNPPGPPNPYPWRKKYPRFLAAVATGLGF